MAKIRLTFDSLYKIGVQLLDTQPPRLRCRWCRTIWSPERVSEDRLERAWWKCPSGCVSNYEHARERHREWVDIHALAEFDVPDREAIEALDEYDLLIAESYGELGDLLPNMPIDLRMHFEIPASAIEEISNRVRHAAEAAKDRGAPFAYEIWHRIWLRLRSDLGVQQYLEMEYEWQASDSDATE